MDALEKLYWDSITHIIDPNSEEGRRQWAAMIRSSQSSRKSLELAEQYFCDTIHAPIDNRIGTALAIMIGYTSLGKWELAERVLERYEAGVRHCVVQRELGIN